MARRRNSKQKMKGMLKGGSIKRKLFPIVKTVTAPIAFLEQLTSQDRASLGNSFSSAGYGTQLKIMSNLVMGRLAGITPFHGGLPTAKQTINPSGVLNKWTNAGLIGLGYKIIGSQINKTTGMSLIPETSSIGSIAKSAFVGGALGGFFSEPTPKTVTQQSFPTTSSMVVNGNYNSGQDSTLGSN
mgnify:CR=1 FL=1|tara:strand:- start:25 stop:579 length:555 start_codon:yes stop_codon:yes gene_type:complete